MKPLVLVTPPRDAKGNITLTVDELRGYIDQAYDAGFGDGQASVMKSTPCYPYYPFSPQTVPTPTVPTVTWDWSKVTCNDKLNVNTSTSTFRNATSWTPNDAE